MGGKKPILRSIVLKGDSPSFTIHEVIEQASNIFGFTCEGDTPTPKRLSNRPQPGPLYRMIRNKFEEYLKDCPPAPDNTGKRNKRYRRELFEDLLNNDLRGFFLEVSAEQAREQKDLDRAKEAQKELKALETKRRVAQEREQVFIEDEDSRQYGTDDTRFELSLTELIEQKKKEIFIQFLMEQVFDIFIKLDRDLLEGDLRIKEQIDDNRLKYTPIQVSAIDRLNDLHYYYEVTEALPTFVNALTKKAYSTFKQSNV